MVPTILTQALMVTLRHVLTVMTAVVVVVRHEAAAMIVTSTANVHRQHSGGSQAQLKTCMVSRGT